MQNSQMPVFIIAQQMYINLNVLPFIILMLDLTLPRILRPKSKPMDKLHAKCFKQTQLEYTKPKHTQKKMPTHRERVHEHDEWQEIMNR